MSIDDVGEPCSVRGFATKLGKTALLPSDISVAPKRDEEGARGGTMGSAT
jgi:hypothetical protein